MEGFILKSIGGLFYVLNNKTNEIYTCKAKGQFRNINFSLVCGDEVIFEHDKINDFSNIIDVKPRKNYLIRPLIANVDVALIVMSTIKPNFDSYLVDKLIVLTTMQNIEPIIVVSKCEFLDENTKSLIENYKFAGYKVILISSHQNINIDLLKNEIKNKKVVLCGQSAVGKSSLINALAKNQNRLIGDFSEKLGRGKHQTREVEYINIDNAYVADTPGFSKLDIKIDLVTYAHIFKDFAKYSIDCKYKTCLHKDEPFCKVKEAVSNNLIDKRRYDNYIHLMNEIKDGKHVWRKK